MSQSVGQVGDEGKVLITQYDATTNTVARRIHRQAAQCRLPTSWLSVMTPTMRDEQCRRQQQAVKQQQRT